MTLVEDFGRLVRQLREARDWSQEQLAERCGLNRSYVGEVERGRATASIVTARKFALAFELDLSGLFAHCEALGQRRRTADADWRL
ncbi:MAG: helix-turn-helix transcriptional regulator [Pseudomonas sp.]